MSRDQSIDLLKGIGMLFVVAGHAGATSGVFSYIYSFHMPLFAFIGGLFLRTDQSFMNFARKKVCKLLVPFYFWSLVCWSVYGILIYITQPELCNKHIGHLIYIAIGSGQNSIGNLANVTLWFLPFLFVSSIIHYLISWLKSIYIQIICVILLSFSGVICYWIGKPLPYSIDTAFALYPFVWVGSHYLSVTRPFINSLRPLYWILLVVLLLCIHFVGFLWEYLINDFVVDTASNSIGNYFLFYIGAFAAIGYWSVFSSKVKVVKPLNYIGANAVIVLIFHYPIVQLMRISFMPYFSFLKDYGLYGWAQSIICLLLSVPICCFVNKFMRWSIGGLNIPGRTY